MAEGQTPGPTEFRDPLIRNEIKRAGVWIGMIVAVALVALLAQPILLILGAIVFAAGLDGGTRLLGRLLPIGRGWRLTIVLLSILAFLAWVFISAGNQLVAQAATLQDTIITQIDRLLLWARTQGLTESEFNPSQILEYAMGSVGRVTAAVSSLVGGLTALFMIFILGLYLAIEPRLYERGVGWLMPQSERSHFYEVTAAMGKTLRRLMAGRILGMLVEGIATWILLGLYGIPMATLLGVLTGLLVFIPNIGAAISGILMVLVGFSVSVDAGLYCLFVYFIVQFVDGNIIVPMIAKRTVDLAPALVLGAQILFGALFGLLGLALADPIIAMIKVFLEKNAERQSRTSA
ncbi:MAG: AI-2E family transporter [Sphingopyxis sp.]|nr:AI-2E family transporter [Sphingopyxis sp.]